MGLINESPNGIVSFEGNSTFYLNPFSLAKGYNYLFKKVQTGINYSRFDNDDRTISIPLTDTLSIIQKSFLNIHTELDVFELRVDKRFPYKFFVKARGDLDITEINRDTTENKSNVSTISIGLGAGVQIERFSNFGLNTAFYYNRYQNNNVFDDGILNFNTIALTGEVYFYSNKEDQQNAFFLRLNYEQGTRDLSSKANFFTIQFGYKAQLNFQPKNGS